LRDILYRLHILGFCYLFNKSPQLHVCMYNSTASTLCPGGIEPTIRLHRFSLFQPKPFAVAELLRAGHRHPPRILPGDHLQRRGAMLYVKWPFFWGGVNNPLPGGGRGAPPPPTTPCASPPPWPSIFSYYSLFVHHPVNWNGRHFLNKCGAGPHVYFCGH
jgi:hypothetical protein